MQYIYIYIYMYIYVYIQHKTYYKILYDTDSSNIIQQRVTQFADKYKSILTLKEYNYLAKRKHKISNLYMLPQLHKSKRINEIIQKEHCEYINVEENISYCLSTTHCCWSRLLHQWHIKNTSYDYEIIISNDFTYS